jgi:nickel-dependent lactate racemase
MRLPLGEDTVTFELDDWEVAVAEPPGGTAVDPAVAAREVVADPHGPRLRERAAPGDDVAVVVTDVTRKTPAVAMLDALFEELEAAGVDADGVDLVVGLGLHRPTTVRERESMLGPYADRAVDHDPDAAVEVGTITAPTADREVAVRVHPAVAEADLVCSTGLVEPHQYAGFSGGAKTVVVGTGDESLIGYTHGPELLAREGVRLGRVDENPFRATLDRAGDVAGPDFAVNVTRGPAGVLGASAGRPREVVGDLAAVAREALAVGVRRDSSANHADEVRRDSSADHADEVGYDAVVAGVGAPKDANLYQTSRAATYVALGARNPLRRGAEPSGGRSGPAPGAGRIVIPARLPEGAGEGRGEQRFHERLSNADSPRALYEEMQAGYEPGAQRAFVLARALCDHDVWITDSEHPELVEDCLMHAADSVEDAVEPGSRVLVVPDALNTLLV